MSDLKKKAAEAAEKYASELHPSHPLKYNNSAVDFCEGAIWAEKEMLRSPLVLGLVDALKLCQEAIAVSKRKGLCETSPLNDAKKALAEYDEAIADKREE